MFYRVSSLALAPDEDASRLFVKAARALSVSPHMISSLRPYRKSLDARGGKVLYRFAVDVVLKDGVRPILSDRCTVIEHELSYEIPVTLKGRDRPVVVGFGPSGMFAAYLLARAGLCPIVLERGKTVDERVFDVEHFFSGGTLQGESNVQFGEGGAGTFSDGKLNTLLKDKNFRGRFVLEEFVRFGAPEEILYLNKPHIGTDRLRTVVKSLRQEILRLGGEVYFQCRFLRPVLEKGRVVGVVYKDAEGEKSLPCTALFLGIGHSARDTFRTLYEMGIPMEKKIFSVGFRIEHLQSQIDRAQYGQALSRYTLPAADYKLSTPTAGGKTVYTFCMCPGGVVVPAASEEGGVVTNGMSGFARDEENANSALLYNVLPEELPEGILSGFDFQRKLEEKAYDLGGGNFSAPCQLVGDFLKKQKSCVFGQVRPSYAVGVQFAEMDELLPPIMCDSFREAIGKMGRHLSGFDAPDALLTGVESRATCPVRLLRGEDMQSPVSGLYPIGEGAGFAGGIMSSAMDGMKSVEAYFRQLEEKK